MIIKNRHQQRDAIKDLLNPLGGYRGELKEKGIQPKDHIKMHKELIRNQEIQIKLKQEQEQQLKTDQFKMKKFLNVESKIKNEIFQNNLNTNDNQQNHDSYDHQDIQNKRVHFNLAPSERPGTAVNRPQSQAKLKNQDSGKIIFGRTYSSKGLFDQNKNSINQKPGSALRSSFKNQSQQKKDLNRETLEKFNQVNKPNESIKMEEYFSQNENLDQRNLGMLPPRTPNYGKTPKYLEKYKEEAKLKQEEIEEKRAQKLRPPGTKVLSEDERVSTLESLIENKKKLMSVLQQLPITLRTENLKKQKLDIEKKLDEMDKAIDTFSKKVVYVKMDS